MSPSAGYRHQRLSSQLWLALSAAASAGCEVLEAINVRVAPGRILIPDLAVVSTPGAVASSNVELLQAEWDDTGPVGGPFDLFPGGVVQQPCGVHGEQVA